MFLTYLCLIAMSSHASISFPNRGFELRSSFTVSLRPNSDQERGSAENEMLDSLKRDAKECAPRLAESISKALQHYISGKHPFVGYEGFFDTDQTQTGPEGPQVEWLLSSSAGWLFVQSNALPPGNTTVSFHLKKGKSISEKLRMKASSDFILSQFSEGGLFPKRANFEFEEGALNRDSAESFEIHCHASEPGDFEQSLGFLIYKPQLLAVSENQDTKDWELSDDAAFIASLWKAFLEGKKIPTNCFARFAELAAKHPADAPRLLSWIVAFIPKRDWPNASSEIAREISSKANPKLLAELKLWDAALR